MNLISEILEKIENEKIGSRNHTYYVGMLQGVLKAIHGDAIPNDTELPVGIKIPKAERSEVIFNTPKEGPKMSEKTVVAYKCEDCKDIVVVKHDIEQPHLCNKCETYHHFGDVMKASYHCHCGAKWHLKIEEDVDRLKCRSCGHEHHLVFDYGANEFRSVDDVRGK